MTMRDLCNFRATATGNSGLLATLDARTVRSDAWPDDSNPEPRYLFRYLATADASAFEGVFARRTRVQQVGLRGYVDGVHQITDGVADYNVIVGGTRFDNDIAGWTVGQSLSDTLQGATVTVPLDHRGRSPFGASALQLGTPVPALKTVHFLLAYKLPEDVSPRFFGHPLMMYGLGDSSSRGGSGGVSDQLSFRSNMARYVDYPMTFRLPAGHGFTYGEVIQALCNNFPHGFPEARFLPQWVYPGTYVGIPHNLNAFGADDIKLRKAVELIRGDWLSLAKAIGAVYGERIYEGSRGLLEHAPIRPELGAPETVDGVISEQDIVRGVNGSAIALTSFSAPPTGPTRVELTGSHQITREDGTQRKTLNLSFESNGDFAPAAMLFQRAGDAPTITASGVVQQDAAYQVTSYGTTIIEKEGQTVLSSSTDTNSFFNPTRAAFSLDIDLSILHYLPGLLEANSLSAQSRVYTQETLILTSRSSFSKTFGANGFISTMLKESYGYKHLRAALQSRPDITVLWTDLTNAPGFPGRLTLGGGEGVSTLAAEFQLTERSTEQTSTDTKGFITSKITKTYGFSLRPGWQYRYGAGNESRDAAEVFGLVSSVEETWTSIDEFTTSYQSRTFDGEGNLTAGENDVIEGQPPVAEKLDDATPKRADYQNDADFALAVAASQFEQQAMEQPVENTAVLAVRCYSLMQVNDQWSNEPWQLKMIGNRLILMTMARPVTWTMLPNPLVRLGSWWHVQDRQAGIDLDHDIQITACNYSQGQPGAAMLMTVQGLTWD